MGRGRHRVSVDDEGLVFGRGKHRRRVPWNRVLSAEADLLGLKVQILGREKPIRLMMSPRWAKRLKSECDERARPAIVQGSAEQYPLAMQAAALGSLTLASTAIWAFLMSTNAAVAMSVITFPFVAAFEAFGLAPVLRRLFRRPVRVSAEGIEAQQEDKRTETIPWNRVTNLETGQEVVLEYLGEDGDQKRLAFKTHHQTSISRIASDARERGELGIAVREGRVTAGVAQRMLAMSSAVFTGLATAGFATVTAMVAKYAWEHGYLLEPLTMAGLLFCSLLTLGSGQTTLLLGAHAMRPQRFHLGREGFHWRFMRNHSIPWEEVAEVRSRKNKSLEVIFNSRRWIGGSYRKAITLPCANADRVVERAEELRKERVLELNARLHEAVAELPEQTEDAQLDRAIAGLLDKTSFREDAIPVRALVDLASDATTQPRVRVAAARAVGERGSQSDRDEVIEHAREAADPGLELAIREALQ